MSELADRAAEEFLTAAYPEERHRCNTERWLGLLACHAADGGQVRWWEIPALAPAQAVLSARRRVLGAVAVVVAGWAIYVGITASLAGAESAAAGVGAYLAILSLGLRAAGAGAAARLRHPPGRLRPGPPRAIRPRWPRGRSEYGRVLVGALPLGLGILPALVKQWSVPAAGLPGAAPAGTYRAERLSCLVTGLAWAPVGVLLGVLPALGTGLVFEVTAANAVVAALWGALLSGAYPLLKLSEVVMSADWEERVRFLPLLEDAADRGVLRRTSTGYQFRSDAMRTHLLVIGRTALDDHAALRAGRLAAKGVRAALVKYLTRAGIMRVCVDFAVGTGAAAAIYIGIFVPVIGPSGVWIVAPGCALVGALAGGLAGFVLAGVLLLLASNAKMTLTYVPRSSRKARLGRAVVAAVAVAVLIGEEGAVLAEIVGFVLPAALVVVCGAWACVLALRRTRALRRRWQRAVPDAIAVATTGAALLLLLDHRLLTALPATGLLFPAAVWGSVLAWRKMTGSRRLAVKAGADLVFALLLGGEVVLLLVWLANLLAMPRAEVVVLRAVLGRAGGLADLPWWAWTSAWLLLAAASLAFIRWPSRLENAAKRFARWRIVPVAQIAERALTGLHIGLLTVVFVGLAAPSALTSTVGRQLSAAYEVAFQRELLQEGELAAYTAISSQLAA